VRRFLFATAAAVLVTGGLYVAGLRAYTAPGPLPEGRDVVIPRGGLHLAAEALEKAGVVRNGLSFRAAALATMWQGPIHAAELHFSAGAGLDQVLSVLRFGRPVQHRLTIPEGLTSAQIAILFERDAILQGDVLLPAEGSVLPQTYSFELGALRAVVLGRAEAAMRSALAREWERRVDGLPIRSARQALILASIVERETALVEERPMVARVFLNRMKIGMKLQADPTAAYAASGGTGVLDRPLSHTDLERVDDYNTYVISGLPAEPICNPGIASITAVLHPAASEALYFVADGHGGHVFAERLADHDRNVARFRSLRK
jgi:UPF0755 protein